MKRLSTGVLAVLITAGLGLSAVAAPSQSGSHGNIGTNAIAQATAAASPSPAATMMGSPAPAASAAPAASPMTSAAPAAPAASPAPAAANVPPANFGSPPSGQIPILFNDHHVYSKPDTLKQGRVLAALVRGGTVLIPLRSMFEQMGATVSYDPATKTVNVTKPGADVKVTVGKPEVVINGETRPLDVPPEMYQGHVVVPVRVISEGMGAYVEWVPDRRVVVVRYLPPTPPPPPTAPATEAPTAPPTPTPAPSAAPYSDRFIAGDWIISPKVYNEFSPGNTGQLKNGGMSFRIRGAAEFNLLNLPWMIEGDYRQINYPHNCTSPTDPECMVTVIGGGGQTFVPAFTGRDGNVDARLGLRVLQPRIYVGVGYLWMWNNAGYPKLSNIGFGIEKLPDLDKNLSLYGSAYYYPNVKGNCNLDVCPTGPYQLGYNVLKYDIGGDWLVAPSAGVFLDLGYLGQYGKNKSNAPSDFVESGPYVGIGLKF